MPGRGPSTTVEWLVSDPIAHRGLYDNSVGVVENTLDAFSAAIAKGVPFEFDIQLTADGTPVVAHDPNLARLGGTAQPITEMDTAELQRARIGSSGAAVPLLAEVLELVNGRVPIVLDVRRWGIGGHDDLEQAVAAAVGGYTGPFALQSFDPRSLLRFRRLVPGAFLGQASGALPSVSRVARAFGQAMVTNLLTRPDFISYELTQLPSAWVSLWRRLHIPVLAWTVHSAQEQQRAEGVADNFFFSGYLPK